MDREVVKRKLLVHLIRYVASTQAVGVVCFHAAWMILAIATWQHASGGAGMFSDEARVLMRTYAWLGGVDADGHGDMSNVMVVWAKLSLLIYLVVAVTRRNKEERKPIRYSRAAALSGVVALLGYGLALWPQFERDGDAMGAVVLLASFSVIAAVAAAWAVASTRVSDKLVREIERPAVDTTGRAGSVPDSSS